MPGSAAQTRHSALGNACTTLSHSVTAISPCSLHSCNGSQCWKPDACSQHNMNRDTQRLYGHGPEAAGQLLPRDSPRLLLCGRARALYACRWCAQRKGWRRAPLKHHKMKHASAGATFGAKNKATCARGIMSLCKQQRLNRYMTTHTHTGSTYCHKVQVQGMRSKQGSAAALARCRASLACPQHRRQGWKGTVCCSCHRMPVMQAPVIRRCSGGSRSRRACITLDSRLPDTASIVPPTPLYGCCIEGRHGEGAPHVCWQGPWSTRAI